jgi:ribonuclease Z
MSDDLKIIFLGTGTALPSPRRGMPAIAIQRNGDILLCDCGEGTQMRIQQAGLAPSRIIAVLISHLHGDHLFGLPGFLTSQQMMNRTSPLTIVGPVGLKEFIDSVQRTTNFLLTFPLSIEELAPAEKKIFNIGPYHITTDGLDHSALTFGYRIDEEPKPGRFNVQKANRLKIQPGPLRHQLQHGHPVVIDGRTILPQDVLGPARPGRSITFCPDTRPAPMAIDLARGSQVLIHDSTFADMDRELARVSMHSTAAEAALIAQQAGVQRLILWHISMRYDESQDRILLNDARRIFPSTELSADFLEITLKRPTAKRHV